MAIEVGGACLAEQHHSDLRSLYDRVFSAPPFVWSDDGPAGHDASLTELRTDPTFGIAVARRGGEVIGFAYGHRLPVDHKWWADFPDPLPSDVTAEWPGRTFALDDFAVAPGERGRGIGLAVLSALLDTREEHRAVLSVQPTAVRAHEFYRRTGWNCLGLKGPVPGATPPSWLIFVRDLGG